MFESKSNFHTVTAAAAVYYKIFIAVLGDEVEIFGPFEDFFVQKIEEMYDPEDQPISSCPHPKQIFKLRTAKPVKPGWIIRRQK